MAIQINSFYNLKVHLPSLLIFRFSFVFITNVFVQRRVAVNDCPVLQVMVVAVLCLFWP